VVLLVSTCFPKEDTMLSSTVRRYAYSSLAGIVLVAAASFLAGWWGRPFVRLAARPALHSESPARSDAASVSSTEAIRFPRELWDSAGLRLHAVASGPLTETIELTGKVALNEDRLAHVFPLVEGRVDEVKVQFGQRVRKDDVLVVVQSKEVGRGMLQLYQDRLKLEFARAKDRWIQEVGKNAHTMVELMRSGASIEHIEEALKDRPLGDYRQALMTAYVAHLKAKAHLDRLTPLSSGGAVPARQILEAEAEVNAARATLQSLWEQIPQDTAQAARLSAETIRELSTNIAVAETNLKILGFRDRDLQDIDPSVRGEQLAHYPILAPFDGTVISKDVVLLERVGPERQILTIADLSSVWITADIYEAHLPLLAQLSDQTLLVHSEVWPGREFTARIFYTGDVLHESTRTIALRAVADNAEGLLKPGMFVTVVLPNLNTADVLQVPRSAVLNHEGRSFVFVQTGEEEFVRRDVELGRHNQDFVEVRSGVQAGERVVAAGGFALKSRMLADLLEE
jgi:cobalt-zinc-cadmium efflux system membrane fusion protein